MFKFLKNLFGTKEVTLEYKPETHIIDRELKPACGEEEFFKPAIETYKEPAMGFTSPTKPANPTTRLSYPIRKIWEQRARLERDRDARRLRIQAQMDEDNRIRRREEEDQRDDGLLALVTNAVVLDSVFDSSPSHSDNSSSDSGFDSFGGGESGGGGSGGDF